MSIRGSVIGLERLLLMGLALVLGGCGYHFASSGSGLPDQAKTIYVEKFTNKTRMTGMNDEFMRYLEDEIDNHKRLEIVDNKSDADLVLSGELTYVMSEPLAANPVGEPILYGESMSANAALVDNRTHKMIWESRGISGTSTTAAVSSAVVTTSPLFLKQNLRSQDIARLPDAQLAQTQRNFSREQEMQQMAQNLYASMSEGF